MTLSAAELDVCRWSEWQTAAEIRQLEMTRTTTQSQENGKRSSKKHCAFWNSSLEICTNLLSHIRILSCFNHAKKSWSNSSKTFVAGDEVLQCGYAMYSFKRLPLHRLEQLERMFSKLYLDIKFWDIDVDHVDSPKKGRFCKRILQKMMLIQWFRLRSTGGWGHMIAELIGNSGWGTTWFARPWSTTWETVKLPTCFRSANHWIQHKIVWYHQNWRIIIASHS